MKNAFCLILCMLLPVNSLLGSEPLPGQIIVDPQYPQWFKYAGGGSFFMCGPGDPEDFLYRGSRNTDGTRDGDQMALINKVGSTAANCIWVCAWRSNGGDGNFTENPFVNFQFSNGFDEDILNQWESWFDAMENNDIGIFFVFYDDASCPNLSSWNTGDSVGPEETFYLTTLVNRFEHHKNIIWCVKEEYNEKFSVSRVSNIAAVIRNADDYDHPIAVHKLSSLDLTEFADDPNVDQFAIQWNYLSADALHDDIFEAWNIAGQRYNLNLSESQGHGTGLTMRRKNWAAAMAGAYVMVNGMDIENSALEDMESCGFLRDFFEQTQFRKMSAHDELGYGATKYVMALPDSGYILYSESAGDLGVEIASSGVFDLLWLNTITGVLDSSINVLLSSGINYLTRPVTMGAEVAVYVFRKGFDQSLPVTLSAFKARNQSDGILLTWETGSEVNNAGFIIQKREGDSDQVQMLSSYLTDEALCGMGNSSTTTYYEYLDKDVFSGQSYRYDLQAVSYDGVISTYGPVWIVALKEVITERFMLSQNYPNPFNNSTTFSFYLPVPQLINFSVYDISGKEKKMVYNNYLNSGLHKLNFEFPDLTSGIYYFQMKAGNEMQTRKMIILR